jgi:hypothetical protein
MNTKLVKIFFMPSCFQYGTNLSRITGEFWRMRSTPEKMLQNPEYGQLLRGQNTRDEPGLKDIVLFRNPGSEFLVFIQVAAGRISRESGDFSHQDG